MNDPNSVYLTGRGQSAVILAPRSNAIHQQWKLVALNEPARPNSYNLLNRICEADDYEFLSAPPDGSWVDRYMKDDGQGRQKWQLQGTPMPPV